MPLQIAVIGGGIGGLAAAASLAKKGHKVTVYERSKSATDVGSAFRITPNSDRCLRYLGIDTVEGGAVAVTAIRSFDKDGNVLFERKENEKKKDGPPNKGTGVFAFRPQLTQQLLDVAVKLGVTIKTGVKVISVDTTKTQLTFEDLNSNKETTKVTTTADLIIAADGLNSLIRPYLIDSKTYHPTPSSHHNCLRFMIPASSVHDDPVLSQVINSTYNLASWKNEDKRILVYPVDYGRQYNLVCSHHEELSETAMTQNNQRRLQSQSAKSGSNGDDDTTYNNQITLQQSLDIYADVDPPRITRLFNLADPSGFRIWKLQDLDEIPTWSVGNTVLLGDAAHAVLPFSFSGASMAIEDAVVLAEVIGEDDVTGSTDGELSAKLKKYEEIRKPRVRKVREMGRKIAQGEEDLKVMGEYLGWLGEYDAVEVGKKAREGRS